MNIKKYKLKDQKIDGILFMLVIRENYNQLNLNYMMDKNINKL